MISFLSKKYKNPWLLLLFIAIAYGGIDFFFLQYQHSPQAFWVLQAFMIVTATTTVLLVVAIAKRQRIEQQLRHTLERDRLLAEVALKIRQSLELGEICQTTVTEVRELLQVDRVYIGFVQEQTFRVVAEAIAPDQISLLDWQEQVPSYEEIAPFIPQKVIIADNIADLDILKPLKTYYQHYQIKSLLAVPW